MLTTNESWIMKRDYIKRRASGLGRRLELMSFSGCAMTRAFFAHDNCLCQFLHILCYVI